ncbi:MAG: hypothetical protein JSV24_01740 [Bacteroidales bacterium]|nr:MAG: hypothetical protein JSV24_01740 [Bacteroidales bacterium]
MKTYFFNQNGFPKSLGMVLIIFILGVSCCSQYLTAQSLEKSEAPVLYMLSIPEVTIIHYGFELPPRVVVSIIPTPIAVNDFVADYSYWNEPSHGSLEILATKMKDQKKSSESDQIRKVVETITLSEEETGDSEPKEEDNKLFRWLRRTDNN